MSEPDERASRRRAWLLLSRLVRPYSRKVVGLLAMAICQAALVTAPPWLVGIAIDVGVPKARTLDYWPLVGLGFAVACCAVGSGVLYLRWSSTVGELGQVLVFRLRTELSVKLQRLSVSFHENLTSGQAVSSQTSDLAAINALFGVTLIGLLQSVLAIIVMAAVMLALDVELAVITLGTLLPLIGLTIWQVRGLAPAFREQRRATADATIQLVESLNAIRAVQAFRLQRRNDALFKSRTERLRTNDSRILTLRGIFWPSLELIFSLASLVILIVGGLRVSSGSLEVGVLATFVLYVSQFFGPVTALPSVLDALQSALAGLARITDVLDEELSVAEPTDPVVMQSPVRGEIVLDNVWFRYAKLSGTGDVPRRDDSPEIPGMNLRLPAGQVAAVLGATGAGKSTMAKLIARFYDPTAGQIRLDGVDLRDIADADLRRSIAMLTQEGFLFAGSVADNISVGRPSATRAEIKIAAKGVGADDFIEQLPHGYDTEVHERGTRLSAGQRQMVAFARAFLLDPAVLILDEATSALDIPTERALQHALRSLLAGRTAVIIAHRLSTVEIADRVIVVADGRVIDDGTPAELLTRGTGEFAALYRDGHGQPLSQDD
jgi:ATP-binding cassette subfamily B protein